MKDLIFPFISFRQSPIIFIGGVPRSGTTLMRAMMDAHPGEIMFVNPDPVGSWIGNYLFRIRIQAKMKKNRYWYLGK